MKVNKNLSMERSSSHKRRRIVSSEIVMSELKRLVTSQDVSRFLDLEAGESADESDDSRDSDEEIDRDEVDQGK